MDFYQHIRPLLFALPTETAHHLTLSMLNLLYRLHLLRPEKEVSWSPVKVMGLDFPNPVGLAAGLDKDGDYIDALSCLGFGFIEVGTITPRPQVGNPKPRLFRLVKDSSLINRMGFNNKGVDYLVSKLKKMTYQGIIGVNMGKNADTPLEKAAEDYVTVMRAVYPYSSYLVVNFSSPNTPGLRELQHGDFLDHLLTVLKEEQKNLFIHYQRYVPLVVKVAPDLTPEQVKAMAKTFLKHDIDAVIATNTTLARPALNSQQHTQEVGGLSGQAVKSYANDILSQLSQLLGDKMPLIGVGGIASSADEQEKLKLGASLIQVYTGLIYEGPGLIKKLKMGYKPKSIIN